MLRLRDMRAVDALVIAAEVQNFTFFHAPLVFFSRIRNHRVLLPGRLQDTDLHVPLRCFTPPVVPT